jgi:hypothetical protein
MKNMTAKFKSGILPTGKQVKALSYPHFPTRVHAVIWRNWGIVPICNIAKTLETTEKNIIEQAENMGLESNPVVSPKWIGRSYNTIIRANWHLLPYPQLLSLLCWSEEKLKNILKEEDFLWLKLGLLKPQTTPVLYREFTNDEINQAHEIKVITDKYFSKFNKTKQKMPFDFLNDFENMPYEPSGIANNSSNGLRLAYSYSAIYGDPLIDSNIDSYPESLLQQLAAHGINAIWIQGVLYNLYPGSFCHELCLGYQTRIKNLNKLVERAKKFNIGVYLYFNEPRGPSPDFYLKHPELKKDFLGIEYPERDATGMCTSKPAVLNYLYNGVSWIFKNAPGLAGAFSITMSENPTNCLSKGKLDKCMLCQKRQPETILAEVNNIIEKAVHFASPDARVIVWSWGGWKNEWAEKAIDLLNENIELMCTSEEEMPIEVNGVKNNIGDYSISHVGPGPKSIKLWKHARKRGLNVIAKVQLNNSWECSALPYIPATRLVEEHLKKLRQLNISDFMVSWTLGGYPAMNLDLLNKSHRQMVIDRFGTNVSQKVEEALDIFSWAFAQFPFSHETIYKAPHNCGPANLLYESPTGYSSTMVGFPYDDLNGYRTNYPENIFKNQFLILSEKWLDGINVLCSVKDMVEPRYKENYSDLARVAMAAYCHFRSTYLQISFIQLRDCKELNAKMEIKKILEDEIELAVKLYEIVRSDSRIGFEATNHYIYTLNDLQEKVLNCTCLAEKYISAK